MTQYNRGWDNDDRNNRNDRQGSGRDLQQAREGQRDQRYWGRSDDDRTSREEGSGRGYDPSYNDLRGRNMQDMQSRGSDDWRGTMRDDDEAYEQRTALDWGRSDRDTYRTSDDYRGYDRDSGARGYGRGGDYGQRNMQRDWNGQRETRGGTFDRGQSMQNPSGNERYGQSDSPMSNYAGTQERGSGDLGGQSYGQRGHGQGAGSMYGQSNQQRGGFAGKGPKGYRRSDERLQEQISDALTDEDTLDASDIEIKVEGGDVTLSGTVSSRYCKRLAEDIAERCSGVKDVTNQLRIKREDDTQSKLDTSSKASRREATTSATTASTTPRT